MNWFQEWWYRTFHMGTNTPRAYTGYQPGQFSAGPVVNPIVPTPFAPTCVVWPSSDAATVLAATAWMEDDVGGKEGMQAVMNVVLNRAAHPRWWGSSVYTVCMKPLQFSCWNNGSTNVVRFEEMLRNDPDNEQWEIARNLAQLAVSKVLPDITNNADSYHSVGSPYPAGWPSQKNVFFCGSIGGNSYYRLYLDPRSVNPAVV